MSRGGKAAGGAVAVRRAAKKARRAEPAAGPRAKTRVLGVVTHAAPDLGAHFFVETLGGVKAAIAGRPYRLRLNPARLDGLAGLLFLAPQQDEPLLHAARKRGLPCVVSNGSDSLLPYVCLDNVQAAYAAVCHLIRGRGRRPIAVINGKLHVSDGKDRFDGYRRALADHGIPFRPDYVATGDFSETGGYEAMKRLLALPDPPDAVFAANDHMAVGALRAARERGMSAPDDVAVIGFDGTETAARHEPPLSTVQQPLRAIAKRAAGMLLAMLEGRRAERGRVLLRGVLIVRQSSAPADGGRR
jgi:LacI family transcriptional regulator